MSEVGDLLGLVGPASFIVGLVVFALLSERLGAVTKRPPLYRWFFISIVLVSLGLAFRVTASGPSANLNDQSALIYDLLIVAGLLLAVIVAWSYWGWLLREQEQEHPK